MSDVTELARSWWLLAVLGVVSLIAGILAIVYPGETLLIVGLIFGVYLLLAGMVELVNTFAGEPTSRVLSAIVAIIAILAGLMCLRRPGDSLLALVLILGSYLVVAGVVRVVSSAALPDHRGWALLGGVLDLILGILILAAPGVSLASLALLFGLSLVFRGAIALVGAFQLRKLGHGGDVAPTHTAPA